MPPDLDAVAGEVGVAGLRKPRLIASDLDGTLLRSDGTVSERTIRALRSVQAEGIGFVMVTARPPRWLHDLAHVVGDHGVVLCSNGAFVYDVTNRTVLSERPLAVDVVTSIVADLRAVVPGIAFAVESAAGFAREPGYVDLHPTPAGAPVADIADLLDPLPGKLLARAPGLEGETFLRTVVDVVGDGAVVAFSGVEGLAEISAAGVTKAAVLAEWAAGRGVEAADVWAFGDMPNDLPMLHWAGVSFAVANAHPDVLAAATYVVAGHDDDGVARTVELIR